MIIDNKNKKIIITKDSPVREININKRLKYMWRNNDNEKIKVDLGPTSNYLNYKIKFERIYLLKNINTYYIHNDCDYHFIKELVDKNVNQIVFNCLEPNIEVEKLANRLKLNNISMAEIGFKFLVTTKYLLSKLNIKSYDLYAVDHFACKVAKNYFYNDKRVNVYEGYANERLSLNDHIYDYVFFDCTHRYEPDSIILNELIPHLTKDSVIIFHDYTVPECHKLIDEFGSKHICRTYAINNINALDKARGEIIKIWDPYEN